MLSVIYVVVSLIILEGLLSFDNALVLAAMVQPLPEKRQKLALRIGILGAYLMRGLSIFFVAYLIQNPWLKPVGAAWLLYLMCTNLGKSGDDDDGAVAPKAASFFWTVVAVEFADMAFSIDNIFAAAAFSSNIYAVLAGVAIGILAMRFVAGIFVGLIKKFPVLEKIGYVLVGYIGVTLAVEYFGGLHLTETVKFAGVVGIMALGILYERVGFLNWMLTPVFTGLGYLMGWTAAPIDWTKDKLTSVFEGVPAATKYASMGGIALAAACAWFYCFGAPLSLLGIAVDSVALACVGGAAAITSGAALVFAPRQAS